ncbi:unnamed protein product [Prorocentrum cordatum]|uniref:Ionotropic glutamate receptor C-terminal domain-containing protein n=1 Tax=Prorocentrum cordatum TaxID=2364126 RepID=A0ABN9XYD8_9DINO|nr:unnamed protein product [Polarella glacialis]
MKELHLGCNLRCRSWICLSCQLFMGSTTKQRSWIVSWHLPGLCLDHCGWYFLGFLLQRRGFYLFEKDYSNDMWDQSDKGHKKLLNSLFMGMTSYTGSQPFAPRTNTGKMLSLTYSFFILLLVSAYTANLAVFLVVEQSVNVCNSFDTCVSDGRHVCVMGGTELDEWLTGSYGHLDRSHKVVRTTASPWSGLVDGECDIVVDSVIGYEIAKVSKDSNPDCTLSRSGEATLQHYGGGWMTRTDYADKCTPVLRDALAVHMLTLSTSGEIQGMLDSFLRAQQSQTACADSDGKVSTEVEGLDWDAMLGPLVIHAIGVALAFALYIFRIFRKRRRRSKEPAEREDDEVARDVCHVREQLDRLVMAVLADPAALLPRRRRGSAGSASEGGSAGAGARGGGPWPPCEAGCPAEDRERRRACDEAEDVAVPRSPEVACDAAVGDADAADRRVAWPSGTLTPTWPDGGNGSPARDADLISPVRCSVEV